jgi:hypothetical protein
LEEITLASLNFKLEKCSAAEFYQLLWQKVQEYQVDDRSYPNLAMYVEYLQITARLDRNAILKEILEFTQEMFQDL